MRLSLLEMRKMRFSLRFILTYLEHWKQSEK